MNKRKRSDGAAPPGPAVAQGVPAPPAEAAAPAPAAAPQVVNNTTNNINKNTINNYFAPAAPAAPADDARPANLFATNAERCHKATVKKDGKACSVYVSAACRDGTLKGGCYRNCKNQWVGIEWFAPVDGSHITAGRRTKFLEAYAAYKQAFKDGNKADAEKWRAVVEALRTGNCDTCMAVKKLSPKQQACKDECERMRREACARHGGCQYQHCTERGEDAWCVLEADHGTNPKMTRADGTSVGLNDYCWWAGNGGVAAMQVEAQQIHQWICSHCHALEPTSNQGRRCGDPDGMPPGKQGKDATPEEVKQYEARRKARVVYPKQRHVDARKRDVGACLHCRRAVVAGEEVGFDWDHRDEATKCKGGLYGEKGGVAGLVGNCAKAAALDEVAPLLDAEMDKCDLLCRPCHRRKTHGHPRRAPVA
tara:strand:+ start:5122 stop:6390 length:1269 start_codon:yes stop_codon:yes gene_type:complete